MTSQLEQNALLKCDGAFAVVGNAYRNVRWGEKVLDYLLIAALSSSRVSRVLVVASDRDPSTIRGLVPSNVASKLEIQSTFDEHHCIDEWCKLGAALESDQEMIVFLYSFTEVCHRLGAAAAVHWLCQFNKVAPRCKLRLGCILHQSLHADQELSYLLANFRVVARVIPNYGTMAEAVAAEVLTIRRSATTGKVTEEVEMLQWNSTGLLEPRPSKARVATDVKAPEKSEVTAEVSVAPLTSAATRLITFDATDPEFDDDEDADADLDL